MDRRVREIAERLDEMLETDHPLAPFVISYFKTMLDEWRDPGTVAPAPFGDSPLLKLVESMLPSVDAEDSDSGMMIRTLMERVRLSRDPAEKRTLSYALEWFYLYFTHKTDLEFEAWLEKREKQRNR